MKAYPHLSRLKKYLKKLSKKVEKTIDNEKLICYNIKRCQYAPLAQLDRATAF